MLHSKRWIHVAAAVLFLIVASPGHAQNTSQSRQVFDSAKGIDVGYDWGPRAFADVNGDRKADFCRFVGDPAKPHIACMLAGASGFGADQYAFRSVAGIDRGYDWAPRAFVDVSGDRRADFCRFVGDPAKPHIACMIAGIQGFNADQYEYRSEEGIDVGQKHGRGFVDVNGDGRADYCRFYEGPGSRGSMGCTRAGANGFNTASNDQVNRDLHLERVDLPSAYVDWLGVGQFCQFADRDDLKQVILCAMEGPRAIAAAFKVDAGYAAWPRGFADVDGDRRPDYCRFVGTRAEPFLACLTDFGSGSSQYAYRSEAIDPGRSKLPWGLVDVTANGRADFCRFMEEPPNAWIRCTLADMDGIGFVREVAR